MFSPDELRARAEEYGPWVYRFDLGHGVETPLHNDYLERIHHTRWRMIRPRLEEAFGGRWDATRALDVACNEGWFSLHVAKLGAAETVGIDARESNIEKARFVQEALGVPGLSFRAQDLFEVDPDGEGSFDLVLCLGLLYHLEDPMGAVRRLRALTRGLCVIETEVARPATIEIDRGPSQGTLTTEAAFGFAPEPDALWNPLSSVTGAAIVPTLAALESMLEVAGFGEVERGEPDADAEAPFTRGDRVVLFARP
jgi:tRNA (mo5U34)-methyltransferase